MPGLEATRIAHYRLQRRLGRGGMSEVYLATDEHEHYDVAIKLINKGNEEYSQRFQREIEVIGRLKHEHILATCDSGEYGPWYYFVMPYIEQGTLREQLANGPLTLAEAGDVLDQVAGAVQYAHAHDIIHRDIKPSNILLNGEQHVYLADFGLAKALDAEKEITLAGCMLGTPEYMAPELVDWPANKSNDIYALGVLLYQMLTGQVPFKGPTAIAVCWKHLQEQPPRPSLLNPAIARPVEQVILCALEKDPGRRFQSASALARAYNEALMVAEHSLAISTTQPILSLPHRSAVDSPYVQQGLLRRLYGSFNAYRMRVVLMALVLLLIVPLSLGFLVASNSIGMQMTPTLGTNAVEDQGTPALPWPPVPTVGKTPGPVPPIQNSQKQSHGGDRHRHRHGHHKESSE